MGAAVLDGEAAADEVGDVDGRAAPGERLPVDDDRPGVSGLEEEVVESEVAVSRRARSRAQAQPRREVLGEEAAHVLVLGGEGVGVALQEPGQQRGHERGEHGVGVGRVRG